MTLLGKQKVSTLVGRLTDAGIAVENVIQHKVNKGVYVLW